MKLLGIELSSERGSVALRYGAGVVARSIATPRQQTAELFDITRALLAEGGLRLADLDGIAFGRGPGSFTGLRVAAAAAQGFALSTGVPLLPVSSLAALAQGVWRTEGIGRSLVAVDARMGEVYCAEYAIVAGLAEPGAAEALIAPAALAAPAGEGWAAAGSAFGAYAEAVADVAERAAKVLPQLTPEARDLLDLAAADLAAGRSVAVEEALPVYLRGHDAWRRSGL